MLDVWRECDSFCLFPEVWASCCDQNRSGTNNRIAAWNVWGDIFLTRRVYLVFWRYLVASKLFLRYISWPLYFKKVVDQMEGWYLRWLKQYWSAVYWTAALAPIVQVRWCLHAKLAVVHFWYLNFLYTYGLSWKLGNNCREGMEAGSWHYDHIYALQLYVVYENWSMMLEAITSSQ